MPKDSAHLLPSAAIFAEVSCLATWQDHLPRWIGSINIRAAPGAMADIRV